MPRTYLFRALLQAALWIGKIPFTDIRLTQAEFAANKAAGKYPNGQVPVMYVNGECLPQSGAMARYAGKLAGLYPTDALAAFKVDAIIDTVGDAVNALLPSFFEKDAEKKMALRQAWTNTTLAGLYTYLGAAATPGKPFLVGDSLTIADIQVLVVVKHWFSTGILDGVDPKLIDNYKPLCAYFDALLAVDTIKEYLVTSKAARQAADDKEKAVVAAAAAAAPAK